MHHPELDIAQWPNADAVGYTGVDVDDFLLSGDRRLSDALVSAMQQTWKTSSLEQKGAEEDSVQSLRFLGVKLERVDETLIESTKLPVGTFLMRQLED